MEIARGEGVRLVEARADAVVVSVRTDGVGQRAPQVVLETDLGAWDCDCESAEDPCEHVAAAAIAWRRAGERADALPRVEEATAPPLHYELRSGRDGLRLLRFAGADAADPLGASLRAIARGRVAGPRFEAADADWEIDEILGDRHRDALPRGVLPQVLAALRGRPLRLDGRPVEVAEAPLRAQVVLDDAPGGFRLRLLPAANASERVVPGVALRDDVLHLLDEGSLDGRERETLPRGVFYANDRAAELVGEVLPDLEGRVVLEIRSERLPRSRAPEAPALRVTSERVGDTLRLRADVVYGDPPRARVDGADGALVSLGGALPVRDRAAETRLTRRAQRDLELPVGAAVDLGGDEAFAAAARLAGADVDVTGAGHREFFRDDPLAFALGSAEAFAPSFRDPSGRGLDPAPVLAAWERGARYVALEGGGFAPLPRDWLDRHGRILAAFLEARGETGRSSRPRTPPPLALHDWSALCEATGEPPPAAYQRFRRRLERLPEQTAPALPADLRAELRDYQREGVRWLGTLRELGIGALLADDMGLGKTLQVLCCVAGRALVVAPTSVLANWADEAERFRPALRVSTYHGPRRVLDPDADLTLTSYAILRRDREALTAVDWDIAVLDEAQAIKNPESQSARAAAALRASWRVSLTGTPVENRLDELWSQLQILNPGHLGGRGEFGRRYARPIEAGDAARAEELRRRLRPVLLRRLKTEVARELPPRTDLVLHVELDEEERRVYDALRQATRRELLARLDPEGAAPNTVQALEALLRLRQAACHRGLIPGQRAERSSKVDLLVDRLDTAIAEGHKALVFSQWTGLLDRIEGPLRDAGLAFTRLDGATVDREGVVASFQDEGGPPVFLVSLRAGGTGLNLTAADHVFLMDPWWNPAVEAQAADRTHRIGQDKPVFVHRLVAADTVEEKILALQEHKRAAAESALAVAGGAGSLSRDELLGLLE